MSINLHFSPLFAVIFAIFTFGLAWQAPEAQAKKCGTWQIMQNMDSRSFSQQNLHSGVQGFPLRKASSTIGWARTLETEHFQIHYSLGPLDVNRIKLTEKDAGLKKTADSLFSLFQSSPKGDSIVYQKLNEMGAPHPEFAQTYANALELAWKHYVDTLGMRAPSSIIQSRHFNLLNSSLDKFPIDIVDIGNAEGSLYFGEIYGLTFPPAALVIVAENDFLYNSSIDINGNIIGTGIKSRLQDSIIHDYSIEWEKGVRVTAVHEFYHGIQFSYTQASGPFHVWYEASATGMEERLAPDVNDYLQYLPDLFNTHATTSFFDANQTNARYGYGIFHQFLTQKLGNAFDVKVWNRLASNNNRLDDAFNFMLSSYSSDMPQLFSEFATSLLYTDSNLIRTNDYFSADIAHWPEATNLLVDLTQSSTPHQFSLPELSFQFVRVKSGENSKSKELKTSGMPDVVQIGNKDGDGYQNKLTGEEHVLAPSNSEDQYYLVITNGKISGENDMVEIRDIDSVVSPVVFAYPNPVNRSGLYTEVQFSHLKGNTGSVQVTIYNPIGLVIREMEFFAFERTWSWDLKDANGEKVKPGVYYFKAGSEVPRPLIIQ